MTVSLIKTPKEDVRCANILGRCLAEYYYRTLRVQANNLVHSQHTDLGPWPLHYSHHPSLGFVQLIYCGCLHAQACTQQLSLIL